ncbi:MAG: glycosyltransferase family 87 protein [Polyangiales bacterium]
MVHSRERVGFLGLVSLTLAPVICHGVWRPIATVLGASGDAAHLSIAALGVAIVVLVTYVATAGGKASLSAATGGSAAMVLSVALGSNTRDRLAEGVALSSVAAIVSVLVGWLAARLPPALDGLASRHRGVAVSYALLGVLCIGQTTRVSTFVGDPTRIEFQALPTEHFLDTHSCLTAYVQGAKLANDRVDNLYDANLWPDMAPQQSLARTPTQLRYAPFDLDTFAYPPPFLLLASVLRPFEGHYVAQRALWFGMSGLLLAAGLWTVARWLDEERWHRALLLAPVVWLSLPTMVLLQIGNAQASVTIVAMLGMIAFDRKRPALGGALLSFAILSKIAPGLLAVWLLAQRRWREAAWTALFGGVWLSLSVAAFGSTPLLAFVRYELPRLGSGEALRFLADTPFNIDANLSTFGLPFRFMLAGMPIADPWSAARKAGLAFTLLVFIVAMISGLRRRNRRDQACAWLALLTLGALRSPFAPGYVCFGALWLLSLVALEVRDARAAMGLTGLWLIASFPLPLPPAAAAIAGIAPIALIDAFLVWVAVRRAPVSAR